LREVIEVVNAWVLEQPGDNVRDTIVVELPGAGAHELVAYLNFSTVAKTLSFPVQEAVKVLTDTVKGSKPEDEKARKRFLTGIKT